MLFPGSRIWYEGAAAELASLTDEIKASGFSGHIVLEFQDSLDVVICSGGEFQRVIEKIGRRILSTKKYREIWGKCQIKQGRMTIFELAPPLVRRLRGLHGRRLLCSGTLATGCDPERLLDQLRARSFSGILDCVSSEGKLLLDFDTGEVVACFATEYQGLSSDGLEAFTSWHRGFTRSSHPCFFFISETDGTADSQTADEILMDYHDQIALPLASSMERLFHVFGREAGVGDVLVGAGTCPGHALYLISGEAELIPGDAPELFGGPSLKAGEFLGLGWLDDQTSSANTVRARVTSRYLALDAKSLEVLFVNSPALGARLLREAAGLVASVRARLEALRAEPRLRDVESAVLQALYRHPLGGREGVPAAEIFRDLTQSLPLTLPEIDALFRKLAALGGLKQSGGRILLAPHVF